MMGLKRQTDTGRQLWWYVRIELQKQRKQLANETTRDAGTEGSFSPIDNNNDIEFDGVLEQLQACFSI